MHNHTFAGALLALACGAAFAAQDTTVSEVDSPEPQAAMTLKDNETFQNPMPMPGNALPAYPAAMLGHMLPPQTVCVRVTIDESGKVGATVPIGAGPDCPTPQNAPAAFYEAAEDAAKAWTFDPAFRCVYPKKVKPAKNGCFGDDVEQVPTAVSLVYRFVFEQAEGQGAVHLEG
jgi:hypothetical protein